MKPAVSLFGASRANYFQQTLISLAPQCEALELPLYIFLDIVPDSTWDKCLEFHHKIIEKHAPFATIIERSRHYGLGNNLIDGRRYLFDEKGYENVFLFEDDMVLGPNYIRMCLDLLRWANGNYPNVGVVQGWNDAAWKNQHHQWTDSRLTNSKAFLNKIEPVYTHWWGYLMTRKFWNVLRPIMNHYQQTWLQNIFLYKQRDTKAIWQWKSEKSESDYVSPTRKYGKHAIPYNEHAIEANKQANITGQDGMNALAVCCSGMVRLAPCLPRAKYVGAEGEHFNSQLFEAMGLAKMPCFGYDDKTKWELLTQH